MVKAIGTNGLSERLAPTGGCELIPDTRKTCEDCGSREYPTNFSVEYGWLCWDCYVIADDHDEIATWT